MNQKGKDNVQCIRVNTLPEVKMPRQSTKVVPMRPRLANVGRRAPVMLEMPHAAEKAPVLQMPARKNGAGSLVEGLRMTLVAFFALLGWPPPTHDNDSGAPGLKQWKVERVNAISKLRVPGNGLGQRAAFADEDVLARAA